MKMLSRHTITCKDKYTVIPSWLSALDLEDDSVEIDVSDLEPRDNRNAAEIWGATLPTLAEMRITEERVRRSRRPTTPLRAQRENYDEDGGVVSCVQGAPLPRHRSALTDATRNAGLLCAVAVIVITIIHAL